MTGIESRCEEPRGRALAVACDVTNQPACGGVSHPKGKRETGRVWAEEELRPNVRASRVTLRIELDFRPADLTSAYRVERRIRAVV
jgi:hypothetical protein